MKSVIPFTKELDFNAKVQEITSISLEREFSVEDGSVVGNLFVTGDYKSHEISVNVTPFSFKIPFTIEIPDNLDKDSITIEISDFAYDMVDDSKITVHIELELEGNEIVQEVEEDEFVDVPVEVDSEEILKMMEERKEEEAEKKQVEEDEEIQEEFIEEDLKENPTENDEERDKVQEIEIVKESDNVLMQNIDKDSEYTTYHIHMVKEGETVETICTMYNSNINLLMDYNDLSNLTPGEKILIPSENE